MRGNIVIEKDEVLVEYINSYGFSKRIPVFKPTREFNANESVEFDIVDEFTHPQLFTDVGFFEGTAHALILGE